MTSRKSVDEFVRAMQAVAALERATRRVDARMVKSADRSVIDLVEVSPGVFAAPRPAPARAVNSIRGAFAELAKEMKRRRTWDR